MNPVLKTIVDAFRPPMTTAKVLTLLGIVIGLILLAFGLYSIATMFFGASSSKVFYDLLRAQQKNSQTGQQEVDKIDKKYDAIEQKREREVQARKEKEREQQKKDDQKIAENHEHKSPDELTADTVSQLDDLGL